MTSVEDVSRAFIDVDAMRDREIRLHGLTGLDEVRTFYYDETNNIRKLYVTERGLNVSEPQIFVLGGIVHDGARRKIDLVRLRQNLRIQSNVADLKLQHIAKGTFLEMLNSPKLKGLFEWIADQDYAIHYSALDPLYWASVDIIDSVLAQDAAHLFAIAPQLKNDLFRLLRCDLRGTAALFHRFAYPGVPAAERAEFMRTLLDLLEMQSDTMDHFSFMMLKGVLQMGKRAPDLPFLNETPNVLVAEFGIFFMHRICLFKTSSHIFDEERDVQKMLARHRLLSSGEVLENFHFARSHAEEGIQLSDVFTGLLGKYFTWINRCEAGDIDAARNDLSVVQERNRALLGHILNRSTDLNPAFSHCVLSLDDRHAGWSFLEA